MDEEAGAFEKIKRVLRDIPAGEVMGYGEVALRAGFPRGARTVVWVLKTCSDKEGLPWHRVVRKDRRIAIQDPEGKFLQRKLLEAEGWSVAEDGRLTRTLSPLRKSLGEETLDDGFLSLVPQRVGHAAEMYSVLQDEPLYRFTGGQPPSSLDDLERRFARLEGRMAPGGHEHWWNWVVQSRSGELVGFIQASVVADAATLAWVIGLRWQRQGYARRASVLLVDQLRTIGCRTVRACILNTNLPSQRIASSLGMTNTGDLEDGEEIWVRTLDGKDP